MKISVIVPTYNRPQALELCLRSLAGQSMLPAEVLIADDGSGKETRDTVQKMEQELKQRFPIKHVWQEDIGFRKPKILNETVRQSSGDHLLFIDGDCMAHRHFVRTHVEHRDPDAIVSGRRVELGSYLTKRLLEEKKLVTSLSLRLLFDSMRERSIHSRRVGEALRITNRTVRRLLHLETVPPFPQDGVWGCNFSISRDLFYAINGCDEEFVDGSIEDTDLGVRALNRGKKVLSVRYLTTVFHLWHPSTWNFESEKYRFNLKIIQKRVDNKESACKHGIVHNASS